MAGMKSAGMVQRKRKPVIEKALAAIREGKSILPKQEFYRNAGTSKQVAFENVNLAFIISHRILDITLDDQAGMFFETNLRPLLREIMEAQNEVDVFDVKAVDALIFPLWMVRHSLAMGKIAPWTYHIQIHEYLPDGQAQLAKEFIDGMKGY